MTVYADNPGALPQLPGITSSSGTLAGFAAIDHVHPGLGQILLSGNTAGATQLDNATYVFAGGNSVTLSAAVGGGAMSFSIMGRDLTGANWRAVNLMRNTWSITGLAQSYHFMPFTAPHFVTVSTVKFVFERTIATGTATVSGAATMTMGVLSADTANSRFVQIASATYSLSHSLSNDAGVTSASRAFSGFRTTTLAFDQTFTLDPSKTYAYMYGVSLAGSGTMNILGATTVGRNLIVSEPWGQSTGESTRNQLFMRAGHANPCMFDSSLGFLTSIPYSSMSVVGSAYAGILLG